MTKGMEPRWPGEKLPCAIIRPFASNTAVEKSSPSRTASLKAVCRIVVPSSSAMDTTEFQMTVKVMGSMDVPAGLPALHGPAAAGPARSSGSSPGAARSTSISRWPPGPSRARSPGGMTVVASASSTMAGPSMTTSGPMASRRQTAVSVMPPASGNQARLMPGGSPVGRAPVSPAGMSREPGTTAASAQSTPSTVLAGSSVR